MAEPDAVKSTDGKNRKRKPIFVSYASVDRDYAERLVSEIEAHGFPCWMAPRDFPGGANWREARLDPIEAAEIFLVLLSANANQSEHVRNELKRAASYGKTIVPLRIENVTPSRDIEVHISALHAVDLFEGIPQREQGLREFLKFLTVQCHLSNLPTDTSTVPEPDQLAPPDSQDTSWLDRIVREGQFDRKRHSFKDQPELARSLLVDNIASFQPERESDRIIEILKQPEFQALGDGDEEVRGGLTPDLQKLWDVRRKLEQLLRLESSDSAGEASKLLITDKNLRKTLLTELGREHVGGGGQAEPVSAPEPILEEHESSAGVSSPEVGHTPPAFERIGDQESEIHERHEDFSASDCAPPTFERPSAPNPVSGEIDGQKQHLKMPDDSTHVDHYNWLFQRSVANSEQPRLSRELPARTQDLLAPGQPQKLLEDVPGDSRQSFRCSVFFSERVAVGEINRVIACVHLESVGSEVVREAAKRLELHSGALLKAVSQWPVVSLAGQAKIDITADVPGLTFETSIASLCLWEDKQMVEFRFKAPVAVAGEACRGAITFWLEGVLIASVLIVIFVANDEVPEIFREALAEANARPYRKVFPSYSHDDAEIVASLEIYAASFGDEYLRDVKALRAGQTWSHEIQQLIGRADVLQLFWSGNAAKSPHVEQEWRRGLVEREKRPDPFFVRPVYWTQEPVSIPAELQHLHFVRAPIL